MKGGETMNESKTKQFLFCFEIDDEELQETMQKIEQALKTLNDCVFQLEQLGVAKVHRKEKTANDN